MKRKAFRLVCGVLVLLGFQLLQGQGVPSPRMEFEEMEHDFGVISEGDIVTHIYRFRNTGGDTLKIGKVRAS